VVEFVIGRPGYGDIGETAPHVSVQAQGELQGLGPTSLLRRHRLPVLFCVVLPLPVPLPPREAAVVQEVVVVELRLLLLLLLREGVLVRRRGLEGSGLENGDLDRILDLLSRLDGGVVVERALRLGSSCRPLRPRL